MMQMMQPLDKTIRAQLERTVKEARVLAEDAARAALEQIGVAEPSSFPHLSDIEKDLRRKLRAHGRQLGDSLNGGTLQSMDRLIEETAYQHWHRMLFSRFLAENSLLMYPDPSGPVAVTLEECEDLAADEGASGGWELAARFATRMLPQVFRIDSPVFQLVLPPEHQHKLERLLASLPSEIFTASDSLGWVYQFWQAKKKEDVNTSEVKIGARELPAVTQLFTEPYMVSFLLDNSLGAWWAAGRLSADDFKNAKSEDELRQKAAIPGVPLEYLRFMQDDEGTWLPAAGPFSSWPKQLAELKTIDPSCGSGHFLVAAFLMLVPLRMEMEGLSAQQAVNVVLQDNLHGLELDPRCVELAAFALALTAWRYPDAGGYRALPELHLACSGLSVSVGKEEWKKLGLGKKNLSLALEWMHDIFQHAPVLGSLINPARSDAAKIIQWDELSNTLADALKQERTEAQHEAAVVAQGLAKAAILLSGQYQWVITNVPYLARGKQDKELRDFCDKHYSVAKNDLATVFLDRCLELCSKGGTASIVLPQNWLFLTSYKKFRDKLLRNDTWHLIARLGAGAFETISGEVVKAILITLSRGNLAEESGGLFGASSQGNIMRGVDVSEPRTAAEKAVQLLTAEVKSVVQARQLDNPDARVALEASSDIKQLGEYANGWQGIASSDFPRFGRKYWEMRQVDYPWVFHQSTVVKNTYFGGRSHILMWEDGYGLMTNVCQEGAAFRGVSAWGKVGIVCAQMNQLPVTIYGGTKFDNNSSVITVTKNENLPAIWSFCSSPEYNEAVRQIDQSLKVTNATLVKVPFDLDRWTTVAAENYPKGLPKPYSNDPTQWIFHGHPCGSVIWDEKAKWTVDGPLRTDKNVLHVAVARMLGYRWPAELDAKMDLSDEQREWVKKSETLLSFVDSDGIVCVPPVRGEQSAAHRLLGLLAASYGDKWSTDTLAELLNSADHADKTLETWLRDKFFTQHYKLFQDRPFIWHIWDGLRDGFAALVNYHKLDRKLLETLIYTYLGDWIVRQKQDIVNGIDGAEERLDAAETLKKNLELILEGEEPYDIFVRWKSLKQQPVGWNPDINDGVRVNIRPFLYVPDVGKKGAGVLRDKPNINWKKDRGTDVDTAPWYDLGLEYGGKRGDRINDHHLTIAEKNMSQL